MLKKILIACVLLVSSVGHASLIDYNGYSRDDASNIVTGGGLEWLKWDLTTGMSINGALDAYAADGWRLAGSADMASLLNAFNFWDPDLVASDDNNINTAMPWTADENSPHNNFALLFGTTWMSSCSILSRTTDCYLDEDPSVMSRAKFGSDLDGDGRYSVVSVYDDFSYISVAGNIAQYGHAVYWFGNSTFLDNSSFFEGVALTRTISSVSPTPVPTPGTISLLSIALATLIIKRRGKKAVL